MHFCHLCPSSFVHKTTLQCHLITHKKTNDFICNIDGCKAAFKSSARLKRHTNITHFKIRNHECRECMKRFSSSWRLKVHMYTHLADNSSMETPCPECHKIFKSPHSMKNHLVYHKPPKHRCTICEKEYFSLSGLKTHLKIFHQKKKDFDCQYCGSTYPKNCSLNRHILTAHLKQKIVCQVKGCSKSFPLHERYQSKKKINDFCYKKFIYFRAISSSHQNSSQRSGREKSQKAFGRSQEC